MNNIERIEKDIVDMIKEDLYDAEILNTNELVKIFEGQ